MVETLDKIVELNVKSLELFGSSKSAVIRDEKTKSANRELANAISSLLKIANSANGTAQEMGTVRRVKVRLNSALRLLDKFLETYTETNKMGQEKERRQKEAKEARIKLLQGRVTNQKNEKAQRELNRLQGDIPALEEQKQTLESKIEIVKEEVKRGRGRPPKAK